MRRASLALILIAIPCFFTEVLALDHTTTLQLGPEWDSNVFKNFNNPSGDFLIRILGKNQGHIDFSSSQLFWNVQLGGKKYFENPEQDMVIVSLQTPYRLQITNRFHLLFEPEIKYQNENGTLNTQGSDINEDFLTGGMALSFNARISPSVKSSLLSGVQYFYFEQNENFRYVREWGGLRLSWDADAWASFYCQYMFSAQQFDVGARDDTEHAVTPGFQIRRGFIFNASYTYQTSDSSNPVFAFENHRVNLSLSLPLIDKESSNEPLLSLHLLGGLQIRNYPTIFGSTLEGERFLLSGAEDDNFNSITAKLTYHPSPAWALEGKYTRYSNELSTSEVDFERTLLYLGARYSF